MSEIDPQKYLVRDPQGNVYGPADIAMLRDWVGQGRIVAGMHIAPRETREWVEVSTHPGLADLFGGAGVAGGARVEPVRPTTVQVQTWQPQDSGQGQQWGQVAGQVGTMAYETPVAQQRSVLARLAMIFGIASPVMTIAGCLPICICVCMPVGAGAGLAAIVMGIIALVTVGAEQRRAKIEAIVGIAGGAITFVFILGLLLLGMMQPVAAPPVPVAPGPVPVAPGPVGPGPAPAPGPEVAP